jgi:MoaA/NifB/PqqE/SkfB family radical SAM enzyme
MMYSSDLPHKNHAPFKIQFHMTDICNLRCIHCYDSKQKIRDLPLEELKRIIDNLMEIIAFKWERKVNLVLTGGEPLASKHFFPLLSYVQEKYKEQHVIVKVLSNGTLLTEDVAKKIVSGYPILKGIMVSLDGVREETHDKIRGKDNYKKALKAFGILNKYGIRAATHMVVHKGNFNEAFLLTDLAKRHNLNMLTVTRLVPIGCGKEIEDLVISKKEVRELYLKLSNDADDLAREGSNLEIARFRCDWPVLFTPKDHIVSELYYPYEKNGGACAVARHAITVLSDGTVLPCQRMPIELGNVLETDFATLWNHPFLASS